MFQGNIFPNSITKHTNCCLHKRNIKGLGDFGKEENNGKYVVVVTDQNGDQHHYVGIDGSTNIIWDLKKDLWS